MQDLQSGHAGDLIRTGDIRLSSACGKPIECSLVLGRPARLLIPVHAKPLVVKPPAGGCHAGCGVNQPVITREARGSGSSCSPAGRILNQIAYMAGRKTSVMIVPANVPPISV